MNELGIEPRSPASRLWLVRKRVSYHWTTQTVFRYNPRVYYGIDSGFQSHDPFPFISFPAAKSFFHIYQSSSRQVLVVLTSLFTSSSKRNIHSQNSFLLLARACTIPLIHYLIFLPSGQHVAVFPCSPRPWSSFAKILSLLLWSLRLVF